MFFDSKYCHHERQSCPPRFYVRPLGWADIISVENETDIALDMVLTEMCWRVDECMVIHLCDPSDLYLRV